MLLLGKTKVSLDPFKMANWTGILVLLSSISSLYTLDINPHSSKRFTDIFPMHTLHFHFD